MLGMFVWPAWIFAARTADRLGKGLRTGARDAMLSDEATPATKAKVFNFHRGMDTAGAMLGPLLALAYLHFYPGQYKLLFFIAFLPGALSMGLLYLLKEKKLPVTKGPVNYSFLSFVTYLKTSFPAYRYLFAGLLMFTLFNSSDMFILLMAKNQGLSDESVLMMYVFYNLVSAAFSYPMGILADRLGLRNIFVGGLALFAVVYCGFAYSKDLYVYLFLLFLYGIYTASTDGISKAWISNISRKSETATAIGTYFAFNSLMSMTASMLGGLIWYKFGPKAMFLFSSVGVAVTIVYFLVLKNRLHENVGQEAEVIPGPIISPE
jgi:MFS family permease